LLDTDKIKGFIR